MSEKPSTSSVVAMYERRRPVDDHVRYLDSLLVPEEETKSKQEFHMGLNNFFRRRWCVKARTIQHALNRLQGHTVVDAYHQWPARRSV